MLRIPIQALISGLIQGVSVQLPGESSAEEEKNFVWEPSNLCAHFRSMEISGGILACRRHEPKFDELETHVDTELFFFISGIAIMLFMDIRSGIPDFDTAQIVRILPGTQIIIPAGKGHFVPVSEWYEPALIVVVAPKMGDIKYQLEQSVFGY